MNIISFFKNIISFVKSKTTTIIIIALACAYIGAHVRACKHAREADRLYGELEGMTAALADTQVELRSIRADVTARVSEIDAIRARMQTEDEIDTQRRMEDEELETIMAEDGEAGDWMCRRLPDALTEWLRTLSPMP